MAAGLLGGMKHREQDLDTAALFVSCELGVALMGDPPGVGFRTLASEVIRSFAADEFLTNLYSGPGSPWRSWK
jgi:hypothetical protein